MPDKKLTPIQEIEKRFIKWAESRDDDWWGSVSIWDFRIMYDFFKIEMDRVAKESRWQEGERLLKYGKSTLATNVFLADAKAGESVSYEHPDYVCLSRKALKNLTDQVAEEARRQEVARLAVEVMEITLHKDFTSDEWKQGHVHGLKRAIYLINHLQIDLKENKEGGEK